MTKYVCKECGYRYDSNLKGVGKKCPYCGKEKVAKEPAAEELIEEV